jgi:DNA (cytosine-5)-methyltransferase 1
MDRPPADSLLTSFEVCAGAGGQALGLEQAGFRHLALVESEHWPCATLKRNRPGWNVIRADVRAISTPLRGIDLLSGGVPCPPFSIAGKQLGKDDERDLFPQIIRLAREIDPRAVLVENVRGLLDPAFDAYRRSIGLQLEKLGYEVFWKRLDAKDFGVPQLRPRVVLVALQSELAPYFSWPARSSQSTPTVGEALHAEMAALGWEGADEWRERANAIAPTLVGGSKRHGGPDLGPTRARKAWAELGVNGKLLAENPPSPGFVGDPCLTVRMTSLLQGFPSTWEFAGKKTQAYRQVGNAFPPPVALAVGESIKDALHRSQRRSVPATIEQLPLSRVGAESDEAA